MEEVAGGYKWAGSVQLGSRFWVLRYPLVYSFFPIAADFGQLTAVMRVTTYIAL